MTAPVIANGVECYDCGRIYCGEIECPEEPEEHATSPVFVSADALGRPDDADNYHYGLKMYVYDEDVIEPS